MQTTTKELPLVSAADVATAQVPLVESGDAPTRPILSPPPAAVGPTGPPSFPAPAAAAPPPERFQPQAPPLASAPAPVRRAPRRWPVALGSWLGGVVAGMLLLTLALGLFGGSGNLVAASTGDPTAAWDSSITLTDAYLTAQARKNSTGQVQEPTLRVRADGTLAMDGKISLLGRSMPLTATLQPGVADGKLQMNIARLQVGGLPLPQVVIDQIANSVMGATQPPAEGLPATIVRLEVTEGKLVIYSKLQ